MNPVQRDHYLPFHSAGLQGNPFRALTEEELARVAVVPSAVWEALNASGEPHLQIMGEKGRGKTTTLLALAAHLEQGGTRVAREYLPEGRHRFHTRLSGVDVFCLDEVQRLAPLERVRLFLTVRHRRTATPLRLILGTHADLSSWLRLLGSGPVRTLSVEGFGEEHFRAALLSRIAFFALPGALQHATLTPEALDLLWSRFGTDLREAERYLYRVFQARVRTPDPVTASDLDPAL